jgi:hypothetical protein
MPLQLLVQQSGIQEPASTDATVPALAGSNYMNLSADGKETVWSLVAGMTVGDNTTDALANLIKLSTVSKAAHTGARSGFAVLGQVCAAKAPAVYTQCFYTVPLKEYCSAAETIATWNYLLHAAPITTGTDQEKYHDAGHVVAALIHLIGLRCPGWGFHKYVWWLLLLNVLHIKAPVPLYVPVVAVLCAAYEKKYAVIKRTDVLSVELRVNLIYVLSYYCCYYSVTVVVLMQ